MAHKSSSKHWRNPRLEKPSLLHVLCHSHPQVLRLEITAPPTLESTHIIISYKGYPRSDTNIAKRSVNGSCCAIMRSTKVVQSKACSDVAGRLRKRHPLRPPTDAPPP